MDRTVAPSGTAHLQPRNGPVSSPTLTIIIAAKNEAHNIADCVRSPALPTRSWCWIPAASMARASLLPRKAPAVVPTDWPGYGPQQARGIAMARGDWVLSLDADERVTPALRDEILRADCQAASRWLPPCRLWPAFAAQFIHHSGWRPDYTLRLVQARQGGLYLALPACAHDGARQHARPDGKPRPLQLPRHG